MVELTDPPPVEHGFVTGRFVTAKPDSIDDDGRYPDLRGITGNVRFTAQAPIYLTEAAVAVEQFALPLNENGWLVDAESGEDQSAQPGAWLAIGWYDVEPVFPSAKGIPKFSVEVKAEHTKENPCVLHQMAPVVLPPRTVEVTRVIDRQLAVAAAEDAQGFRDEAEQFNTWAGENASFAEGHAQTAAGHASDAETARDETLALGISVDTTVGTRVSVGGHMIYGDTGWRDLSGALLSGWTASAIRIRRVNNVVTVYLQSLDGSEATGSQAYQAASLVSGFSSGNGYVPIAKSFESIAGGFATTTALNLSPGVYGTPRASQFTWTTDQPWPSSLPGTPA